jgi:ribosomal protein L32
MLDFICPTCGHFSLEDESCVACATPASEDLVA